MNPDEDASVVNDAGENRETTVAVFTAPSEMQAELIRGALQASGIPAVIGEQVADAYGGALATGEGYWGEVRVPSEEAEQARLLIAELEAGTATDTPEEVAELERQAAAAYDPEV